MESIGQRLKRLREAKGLTQAGLARLVSLKSQGAIGNIEAGGRRYGRSVVDIAKALGVTPAYLQCETDDIEEIREQGAVTSRGNLWSAVMRVSTAFAGQDQAIRNAAAELIAEAVRRPEAADLLASKVMQLSDDGER